MNEQAHDTDESRWWISQEGTLTGPFPESEILERLKTGTLTLTTYACPEGAEEWKRLAEWPLFANLIEVQTAVPPPPPPPSFSTQRAQQPPRPWNPRTIAWLGLLFSPVWSGIMAAVNTRRVQTDFPLWRPIAIGVGSLVLDLFVEFILFESYLFSLILYLGALWLIWVMDLQPQAESYDKQAEGEVSTGNWIVPVLAGSPAALFVFLVFIVTPFVPLEPREVCEEFVAAGSLEEAKKYSTVNLWPALTALDAMEEDEEFDGDFELTDEAEAPAEMGGYLVGYRGYWKEQEESNLMEGFFHLVNFDETWKVEEWYFTSFNNEETQQPIPLSTAYKEIVASEKPTITSLGGSQEPAKDSETNEGSWPNIDEINESYRKSKGCSSASTSSLRAVRL